MGVRAGDIRQFTVGGREFDPAPESNWTIRLAGEVGLTKRCGRHAEKTDRWNFGLCNLQSTRPDRIWSTSTTSKTAVKLLLTLPGYYHRFCSCGG